MKGFGQKVCVTLSVLMAVTAIPTYAGAACGGNGWNCYKKGMSYMQAGQYDKAVEELKYAASKLPGQAAVHSELAKAYEKLEKYQLAADHYYKQADLYKNKGEDQQSYLAALRKADELNSTVEFYSVEEAGAPTLTLAKYEPTRGAYIGAFIGGEEKFQDTNYNWGGTLNEFEEFNALMGKKHATFFDYGSIGSSLNQSFQRQEQDIKAAGGAVHIAYEPNRGLQEVTKETITAYAEELRDLGVPVFLRYASEMNGKWVPWHGNPSLYIEKWKLVHDIMEQVAPNVAMVWSPSEMPLDPIDAYYPGDAYVDWVGLSIYSAQFENGDSTKPTDRRNPLEALDFIYNKYATRKPIMISEYAASHEAGFLPNKQDTSKFAIAKMTYFYESIKTKYPRVKCIQWYSADNYNLPDKSKNRVNYSLLEGAGKGVLERYQKIIADPYFLSDVVNGPLVEKQTILPKASTPLKGTVKATKDFTLRTWVKSYDAYISQVVYKLNGERLELTTTAPYEMTIPYAKLKSGKNTLEAVVFDSKGRVAKTECLAIIK
ncbi:MAG: glycosyl hydrolase [Niameybacter sp.]|uniref:glycosyl hydrolase n=1 Tax=Niameybacter sp. TaxID=2033640 RepID=UPI002FC72084